MKKDKLNIDIDEMMEVGLHLGHKTSKSHPKMAPHILGIRNTIHIINLEKTKEKLEEALNFIQEAVSQNKTIILVGTKPFLKNLVQEIALESKLSYVNERWLGGTITNFEVIRKRIEYFKDLEQKEKEGFFEKYTKKEQQKIKQEIEKLKKNFEGIKNLERIPDIIFICDINKESTAIREAKRKGVKIVAISDTNANPLLVDFPIPASDNGIQAVRYILEKVKEAIQQAQKTKDK